MPTGCSDRKAAKSDVKKKDSKQKTKKAKEECPVDEPKLLSVEFLDGDDKTELSGTGKQFVNLASDPKWVDGTQIKNIDRLTEKPRVRIKFDKPGAHPFKVKLEPGGGNIAFSPGEKGRNGKFKYQEVERAYATDPDGTKIVTNDLFVTSAGKDVFSLAAQYKDKPPVKSSGKIQNQRMFYVQEIKMKGAAAAANLNGLKSEFAKQAIHLETLGSVEMERMENVGKESPYDEDTFQKKARVAYKKSTAAGKEPYVVAIAYTDHLGVKDKNKHVVKRKLEVGPGKADVEIPILKGKEEKFLWNKMIKGQDWFVKCTFTGLTKEKNPKAITKDIAKAKCTTVPYRAHLSPNLTAKVKIKVSDLPAAKGSIRLQVNWINRFRGGVSFGGGNLICVCTRSFWIAKNTTDQNQIMIHEMGHKVGMVPDGTGSKPDKTATYYDTSQGHVGSHCHKGIAKKPADKKYTSAEDAKNSKCVMYGATNKKPAFCDKCTPAVLKTDISSGWSAF